MKNKIQEYNEFLSIFKNTNFINPMDIEWLNDNKDDFKKMYKEVIGFDCPKTLKEVKALPYIEEESRITTEKQQNKGNCPRCGGTGKMPFNYANGVCFKCEGSGYVK